MTVAELAQPIETAEQGRRRTRPAAAAPIDRPRLWSVLDDHRDDVVLVSAPAGFGKTDAMRGWAARMNRIAEQAVIIDLKPEAKIDERSIAGQIQARCFPDGPAGPPDRHGPAVLRDVLDALARTGVRTLVVELDAHHDVSPALRRVLDGLIRWEERPLGLFVTARYELRVSGGRLRLEGRLLSLGAAELAFDEEEFASVCEGVCQPEHRDELRALTRGWPIAVTRGLACLRQPGATRHQLAGEFVNGQMASYVDDELLSFLPAKTLDAAIRISVVEAFDVDLLGAVAARHDGWRIIEQFAAFCMLESAADAHSHRLHPIVRRICEHRLELRGRAESTKCRRSAALRLSEMESFTPALLVALPTGDVGFITKLFVAAGGIAIGLREGANVLAAALARMPSECFQDPRISLAHAFALAKRGSFDAAAELVALVRQSSADSADEMLRRDLLIAELFVFGSRKSISTEGAVKDIVHHDDFLRTAFAYNVRCMVALETHDVPDALAHLQSAMDFFERAGSMHGIAHMTVHKGRINRLVGDLVAAKSDYLTAETYFIDRMQTDRGGQALARVFLAETLLQLGEFEAAHAACLPAVSQLEQGEYFWEALYAGYTTLHALAVVSGDAEAAAQALARGLDYSRTHSLELLSSLELYRMAAGRNAAEPAMAGDLEGLRPPPNRRAKDQQAFGRAKAWAAFRAGQAVQAVSILQSLKQRSLTIGASAVAIEPMLDLVLMHDLLGNRDAALEELRAALILAARCHLVWPFMARGREITPLIMIAQTNAAPDWAKAEGSGHARLLLQRLSASGDMATSLFTAREQEVLAKLSDNMNNKQIARELQLSPETVRFHLKNIYIKFGVGLGYQNRQVVAMLAREQGFVAIKPATEALH